MSHLAKTVHWWPSGDPSRPWSVFHEGERWEVTVADVAGQPRRYTLVIAGREAEKFADWPPNWTKAPDDGSGAAQRAEFQHDEEYWEKNKDVQPLDDDYADES